MQTTLDCLPCFLRQGLKAARLAAPDQQDLHQKVVYACAQLLPNLDLTLCPPALAQKIYQQVTKITGHKDPFKEYKLKANQKALDLLPRLRELIHKSQKPLVTALHVSIIGNYIDAGIETNFDWEQALFYEKNNLDPHQINLFLQNLSQSSTIMILGDNAGEIVLDILLVEELLKINKKVIYVVRGAPIINDATLEDAQEVGMTKLCQVISSGVAAPGTVLSECSLEFQKTFAQTKLIISKGQGNFEALSDQKKGIFFAFKVKCPVVEKITGEKIGSSIFGQI